MKPRALLVDGIILISARLSWILPSLSQGDNIGDSTFECAPVINQAMKNKSVRVGARGKKELTNDNETKGKLMNKLDG